MSTVGWGMLLAGAASALGLIGMPTWRWIEHCKPALQGIVFIIVVVALVGFVGSLPMMQAWRISASAGRIILVVVGLVGAIIGASSAIALYLKWSPIRTETEALSKSITIPPKAEMPIKDARVAEEKLIANNPAEVAALLSPIASQYRAAVAEIIHALEPRARVTVGGEVLGPDGARTVDIQAFSLDGEKPRSTAIDIVHRPDGSPVSVDAVDIADGKRKDLSIDAMLISSSTGFDQAAIRKAKRVGIGLISILKRRDGRVSDLIEEEIYLRRIKLGSITYSFDGAEDSDRVELNALHDLTGITYSGAPIASWLATRVLKTVQANLMSRVFTETTKEDGGITAKFNFKEPIRITHVGRSFALKSVALSFSFRVEWLSQIVQLDATSAIYDYRRGRVRLGPGKQEYVVAGINYDTAKVIEAPPSDWKPGFGLQPGEVEMVFVTVDGLPSPSVTPPELVEAFAAIEERVRPEDLSLQLRD